MNIEVEFYRPTGKYYSGGIVQIPDDCELWHDNFKQEIINNQKILIDGWQGSYYVLTNDTKENFIQRNYNRFYKRLFQPHEFAGILKTN